MKIFAHRGASAHAPENTEAAIKLAVEHEADGIEIDVFQHGDEFVVIHDSWLDRTTNGTGHITEHSLPQLRGLDAGNGYSIPLLSEIFGWLTAPCELNIEIKGCEDIPALLDYVARHNLTRNRTNILYSSFNHHLLAQAKHHTPTARIAALTASIPLEYAQFAQQLCAESVNVEVGVVTRAMIADAHQRDLAVLVYTVDRPSELRKLRDWGVDGVFTNDPKAARMALET